MSKKTKDTFIKSTDIIELVKKNKGILSRKKITRYSKVLQYTDKLVLHRPDHYDDNGEICNEYTTVYFRDLIKCVYSTEKRILTLYGNILVRSYPVSIVYKEAYNTIAKKKVSIRFEDSEWCSISEILDAMPIEVTYKRIGGWL